MGAIYALGRIMIDSARDHPTIVEVLAAFARKHSRPRFAIHGDRPAACPVRSQTELLAAATVLVRRPSGREERAPLNLRGAHLPGVGLTHAQLQSASLVGADLTRTGRVSGMQLLQWISPRCSIRATFIHHSGASASLLTTGWAAVPGGGLAACGQAGPAPAGREAPPSNQAVRLTCTRQKTIHYRPAFRRVGDRETRRTRRGCGRRWWGVPLGDTQTRSCDGQASVRTRSKRRTEPCSNDVCSSVSTCSLIMLLADHSG